MKKVGGAQRPGGAPQSAKTENGVQSAQRLRAQNYLMSVEALNWYFLGYGRGNRIASFVCHLALIMAFVMTLLTMIDMGTFVWAPLSALHSQVVRTSAAARESLSAMSALTFLIRVQGAVLAHVADNLIVSFTVALTMELPWTVRRARRVAPPRDYIALQTLVGAK